LTRALAGVDDDWAPDVLQRELLARDPAFSTTVSVHFPVSLRHTLSDAAAGSD
jgi:hypothetical protein